MLETRKKLLSYANSRDAGDLSRNERRKQPVLDTPLGIELSSWRFDAECERRFLSIPSKLGSGFLLLAAAVIRVYIYFHDTLCILSPAQSAQDFVR